MVVLLVTTGVLNFVLNDKLTSATQNTVLPDDGKVTETFFAAARSDRDARRESEFLYLDAIINSENSSAEAKSAAEAQKMTLVNRMESEMELETAIKGKGFGDVIVTMGDGGITVVVGNPELSVTESNQILSIVVSKTACDPTSVNVVPY